MKLDLAIKRLLGMSILFSMILIGYVFSENKRLSIIVDKNILDIAENSHFVGCARVSLAFETCKQLSKQYRKEFKESLGEGSN